MNMSFDAVVFPGQGAQKKGMASDFYQNHQAAQQIFEIAEQYLPFDVKDMCFEANDLLHQTNYTQPCILTAEIAMFDSLKQQYGDAFAPSYFGGHSLGEYAALVAAGVLPFDVAIQLVGKRGELMHHADVDGGMAAVIMDDLPIDELRSMANAKNVDVANDNSLTQVVLSGEKTALEQLVTELEQHYQPQGIRCVTLQVSAPFHSRHMQAVEQAFHAFLTEFKDSFVASAAVNVVSNYLGRFYQADADEIITALAKQLSGSVKWRDNMAALVSKASNILELGPNRPLRGFFKTIDVDIASVINLRSADKAFAV